MSRRRQLARARAENNGGTEGDTPAPLEAIASPGEPLVPSPTPAALLPIGEWDLETTPPPSAAGAPVLPPGEAPHVSEDQVRWLTHRMGCATDDDALAAAGISPTILRLWRGDPVFADLEDQILHNKREAFRALGTQLLGKGLRVLDAMLDSDNPKTREKGLTLLLRSQALLIDRVQHDDPAALAALLQQLRAPQTYQPLSIQPR